MTAAERTTGAAGVDYEALALEWEQRNLSIAEAVAMLSTPTPVPPGGKLMPAEEAISLLSEFPPATKEEAAEALKRLRGE